jgi:hypothetical protein
MRRTLFVLIGIFFILAPSSRAQGGFTTVTGTITDPNGLKYACGTISAQLITAGGASATLNGGGFTTQTSPVGLGCPTSPGSGAPGSFTMRLADSGVINPSNTTWRFTINMTPGIAPPAGTGPQSFTVTTAINCSTNTPATCTANAMDISTLLSASAPALSNSSGSGTGFPVTTPVTVGSGGSITVNSGGSVSPAGTGAINATNGNIIGPGSFPAGLLAWYKALPTDTVASLPDYSGNGNNATGTVGTAPTIIPVTGGIACGNAGAISIPAGLNSAKTFVALIAFQSVGLTSVTAPNNSQDILGGSTAIATSLNWILYENPNGGDSWGNPSQGGFRFRTQSTTYPNFNSASNVAFNGTAVAALVLANPDVFYLNSTLLSNANAGNSIGQQSAGNLQLCGNGATLAYFNGTIYSMAIFSGALNAAQIAQATTALQIDASQRNIPPLIGGASTDLNDQIVTIGDSLTAGVNWPIGALAGAPYNIANQGVPGYTTAAVLADAPFNFSTLFRPSALRNAMTYWAGTNDGNTPLAVIARTRNVVQASRSLGFKTVVGTMISRSGEEAFKDSLNSFLLQYVPTFADGIVSFNANVHFGADGACSNTLYFNADCIHLTTFSDQNIIGPYFVHAINRAYGNLSQAGNYNRYVSTGFTIPTNQQFVTGSGGAASVPVTLPFNETAGNFLFANVNCQSATGVTIVTPTDSRANTWNAVTPQVGYNGAVAQIKSFFAMNIGAGANTVTFTFTGGPPTNCFFEIGEWSGVATAAALDATSVFATGSSAAPTSAAVTTTQAGDLLIGAGGIAASANQSFQGLYWTAGGGATALSTIPGAFTSTQVAGAAGSYTASATLAAAQVWAFQTAAFKAVAGTSVYQLQDVDVYSACVPSGANNVGLNLTDAAWMAGESITISNEQSSGSALCTVNGTTPYATGVAQNIDGNPSLNIANGATVELKSILTFTGVPGTNLSPVVNWHQVDTSGIPATNTNCTSSASPAVCGSASAGVFTLPAAATSVTVNTTAVTANSIILVFNDDSLGARLGVTCNTGLDNVLVSARVAGTSFTVTGSAPVTNPNCYSYIIVN